MKIEMVTIPVKPSIDGYETAQLVISSYKRRGWRIVHRTALAVVLKRVTRE